jgi:hypothetical protein
VGCGLVGWLGEGGEEGVWQTADDGVSFITGGPKQQYSTMPSLPPHTYIAIMYLILNNGHNKKPNMY